MCIGAGTVLTVEHAEAALAAGAEFVISPGVNPEVVSFCIDRDVPVFPGIATPTRAPVAWVTTPPTCSIPPCAYGSP